MRVPANTANTSKKDNMIFCISMLSSYSSSNSALPAIIALAVQQLLDLNIRSTVTTFGVQKPKSGQITTRVMSEK